MLTTVSREIPLAIAIHVQTPSKAPATYGLLPDAGMHDLAAPNDVTGQTDIQRHKPGNSIRRFSLGREFVTYSGRATRRPVLFSNATYG